MFAKRLALIVVFAFFVAGAACAAVPPMINYQGKLMQPSGAPVPDGTYPMLFAIYDVAAGGAPIWSETNPSVQVKSGLFAVLLGSINNLGPNIFDNQNRWFGVKVGSDPEMAPRQKIASVGYAVKAGAADIAATVADASITTSKVALGAITADRLAPGVAIPPQTILMWSGVVDQIPQGWVLCDGTNGTPDLTGRFVVGVGSGSGVAERGGPYTVGDGGGLKEVTLTAAQMPRHTHDFVVIKKYATQWIDGYLTCGASGNGQDYYNGTNWITYAGGDQPHENRPPYYALCFIMKLGY